MSRLILVREGTHLSQLGQQCAETLTLFDAMRCIRVAMESKRLIDAMRFGHILCGLRYGGRFPIPARAEDFSLFVS